MAVQWVRLLCIASKFFHNKMWEEKSIPNLNPICSQYRRCRLPHPRFSSSHLDRCNNLPTAFPAPVPPIGTFAAEKLEGSYSNRSHLRPHLHSKPYVAPHYTGDTLQSPSKGLQVPAWPRLLLPLRLYMCYHWALHTLRGSHSGIPVISQTLQASPGMLLT